MIRTWLILAVTAGWLLFLQLEKKDRLNYLANVLPAVPSDRLLNWRSDELYFVGWSAPEATHRWSRTKQPMICFNPVHSPASSHAGISITFEADAVEPLVNRLIQVKINDQSVEYRMSAERQHIFEVRNDVAAKSRVLCVRFELPVTGDVGGGVRDFGLHFRGLHYTYLNNPKTVKPNENK